MNCRTKAYLRTILPNEITEKEYDKIMEKVEEAKAREKQWQLVKIRKNGKRAKTQEDNPTILDSEPRDVEKNLSENNIHEEITYGYVPTRNENKSNPEKVLGTTGKNEEMENVNEWTLTKHPNRLKGKYIKIVKGYLRRLKKQK